MKKLLLLFTLTCIPAISGFTQTILHSEFALLYEINIPGFDIYNSKKLLKKLPAICKVPVDTIPYNDLYTYKTQFNREGNYLLAYAEGYTIKAEIISHFPWKYKLAYYPYKGGLYVYDDMNKPMTRLKVTFDWEKMEYDSLAQLYTFNNLYNGAGITISNGKQKQCFAWTRSYHDRSNYYDDSYGEAKYTGFTITNQPEYKKGDTLKTKIYVCRSDNGKPYKKDIELVINRYPKPAIIVSLKPISPGAYVYQTLINDSFDLDRSYTIDIHEEGKYATLTQANFKVADYKLRETTYQLTPQAYQLYKGDSVGYLFDALDPNGNLIYDAEVDLEIRVKYINRIYDKRVFIPDTLYKGTMAMTATEEGYFTLPSNLFFAYKADYVCEVKATCRNLQNELAHFTHILYIYNRAKPMSVYASRGYFHFIKNGEKNSHVKVKTSFIGDKAEWQEYPIDDSVKINAKATSYEFITQTDTLKQTVSSALIFADVITRTSGDSVFVKPYNPAQVPFYMYYLKDDDIHPIGAGDTLFVLKKNDVVYLYWEYWVADNKIVNTKTLYLKEKNIEIIHTLPEKVFPGEKRTVNIKTRTYKGNPLAQTNLTFFAYNNTFTDDVNTYIPNFDKYYGPGGTSPSGYMYELSKASVNIPIDTAWYKKLKLDDHLYYKTSYSKNTVDYIYLPTEKSDQCLVKVFGMNVYHHVYDPGVVMENETAVYFNKSLTRHIICNEGKHNFTVHMLGKNYELKNVEAKKDSALYIMIHINHPEMVKTAVVDTHTVYWKNKVLERFAFLSIGDLSYSDLLFFDNKTGYARSGSYTNELIVGPFDTLQNVWTEYAQNGEISAIWGQITPFVKNKVRKSGYEILPLKMYEVNIGTLYENLYFSDYDSKKLLKTRNEWITEKTMPAQSYPQLETYLKFKPYYNEMVILDHKMLHGVYGTLLFSLDKNYIKQYKGFITNLTDLSAGSYKIIYVNNRLEPLAEDTFSIQKNGKYYLDLDSTSLYNYQSNYIPHYLRWLYPELIQGDITGKVIDEKGEKVPFAQVNIFYNDSLLHKTYTDINGVFYLSKNTRLTDLNIEISSLGIGYFKLNHFTIANPADTLKITLRMQPIELSEIEINRIDRVSAYASSSTMGVADIVSMNTVSFDRNELQSLVVTPGVAGYFSGARQSSTVFVDSVKVRSGSEAITGRGNERVESILGGVPAKYGDSKNKTDALLGKITNTDKYNNNI